MSNTVKLSTCPKCGVPIPSEAPQGLCPKCVLLGAATATEQGVPATATSEIPSIERIAVAFPQLEVLELIGRGGMGFVFKARQPHLDRFVALKLLPDKLAKDAQFAERFNREGRVLARLNHPNIVSVFDFGQTGGFYYLLMEYVDGVNLRQAMRAGRFSPAEALSIVPKVCEALQYAHEQGILHRDIKPENILLDAKGRVKIADFGIAKLVGEDQPNVTLTNTGAALGTPHYMAPEQLEKPSTVDHRADIYSLGVVFYEMLTGELPIGRFAAPSSKTPVGTGVDEVVFRTLEKDRERRFQSAGEMKTQVQDLGAGTGAAPAQASSSLAEHEERSYSRWSIYGALGVGLSLPVPLMIIVSILAGRGGIGPGELWLALGSVALPGLGGTLLGWLGLNEIRESGGHVRGLPLAMFATLTWPLFVLGGLIVGLPMFILGPNGGAGASHTLGRILMLVLPAGVVTFAFGAIHATGRWATRQPASQERGVLKWIFIGVLIAGMGAVLVTRRYQASRAEAAAVAKENAIKAAPMIQFTFTSVELREEAGARWLAMDYVEQVRGDCQQTFRYDARVPGFTAQTRKDSRLSDAKAGFAPVLHQRILWKLPDSLPQGDALALRDLVAKEWVGKSAAIEPGDERVLFKTLVPDGGTLATAIGVRLTTEDNPLRAATNTVSSANSTLPPAVFGAEEEVVLTGLLSGGGQLALGRKELIQVPPQAKQWGRPTLLAWLADESVDLAVFDYGDDEKYGWGLAMRPTTSRIDKPWESIDAQAVRNALIIPETGLEYMDRADGGQMKLYRFFPHTAPVSFAIRTRSGRTAALQIVAITENPRGVKIRYKVTQNATPPPRLPVSSALEFRLVATDGDTTTPVDELPERQRDGTEIKYRVIRTIMLDGSAVARAGFETDLAGDVAIGIELTPEGARQFGAITTANTGRRCAIVSNGRVLCAPIIHGTITGGQVRISGVFSANEVRRLVATLNRQPAGLEFAPVVERTLPSETMSPDWRLCLDLDSGRILTNRFIRADQQDEWLQASGADILGFNSSAPAEAPRSLDSFHLAAFEAPESAWHNLAADEVAWNWALMREVPNQNPQLAAPTNAPGTFLFRTRENGFGLLQILRTANATPDVKIRYKLVRDVTYAKP